MTGPWWAAAAVAALEPLLTPGGRVLEWGAGGSTVWLAAHGQHVTTVESDLEWATWVRDRCPGVDVRHVPGTLDGTIRSEPGLGDGGRHCFDAYVAVADEFTPGSLDLVVIDGMCRAECAQRAARLLRPGGIAVLDDTNLDFLAAAGAAAFAGWPVLRTAGTKHDASGVWETSIYRNVASATHMV